MNSRPLCVHPHEPEPSATGGGLPSSSCVLKSYKSCCGVSISKSGAASASTYNVLALVGLVSVALDGLHTAVLALNAVLVGALLVEILPLLVVISTSSTLLSPSALEIVQQMFDSTRVSYLTSLAIIIFSITSPERYCSLEYPAADARGTAARAVAMVDHFMFTISTAKWELADGDDPATWVQVRTSYISLCPCHWPFRKDIVAQQPVACDTPYIRFHRVTLPTFLSQVTADPHISSHGPCRSINVVAGMQW